MSDTKFTHEELQVLKKWALEKTAIARSDMAKPQSSSVMKRIKIMAEARITRNDALIAKIELMEDELLSE